MRAVLVALSTVALRSASALVVTREAPKDGTQATLEDTAQALAGTGKAQVTRTSHKENPMLQKLKDMDATQAKLEHDSQAKLVALEPVLEKLKGLDPKSFGLLSNMMSKAEGADAHPSSFLQYLRDDPDVVAERLEKLGPVLEHLKHLDKKRFGALAGVVSSVKPSMNTAAAAAVGSGDSSDSSDLHWKPHDAPLTDATEATDVAPAAPETATTYAPEPETAAPVDQEAPVAAPAGDESPHMVHDTALTGVGKQVQSKGSNVQSSKWLGTHSSAADDELSDDLTWVPNKLSFAQVQPPSQDDDTQHKLDALAPVLERLRGLDSKAFGALSSMMQQATNAK